MRILDEKILTTKILQGDRKAFSIVFKHYYADLVVFAFTFLKDQQTSEETVQDVFIRFWENRDAIIVNGSLKSLLLKSVQNKCIDLIRHNRVRDRVQQEMYTKMCFAENNTESYILYSELEDDLQKALAKLPEDLCIVFKMNRFEGKTYAEIAETLDVSVRTVEVRMGKALALLKEKLKDYLATAVVIAGFMYG